MDVLSLIELLPARNAAAPLVGAVLGLLVGSFLNVVIHRLPLMLERAWALACSTAADPDADLAAPTGACTHATETLNLMRPGSHCPHCKHRLAWFENIPLLSFLALRGRCRACQRPIAWRYPLVEVLCGVLFAALFWREGGTWSALAWCGFCACLLALAFIDWDSTLLPDAITLPLVWAGLLAADWGLLPGTSLSHSLWGAVLGYLSLWSIYCVFKWVTGKEGMGHGDFKLLAALGAWLGLGALLPILLMASISGLLVGLFMKKHGRLHGGLYLPFGPFLCAAALWIVIFGDHAFWMWLRS